MQIPTIPFEILALAPFAPVPSGGVAPRIEIVDLYSLDQAVRAFGPKLTVPVPKNLCPHGELHLEITRLKDFRPDVLLKKVEYLQRLSEASQFAAKGLSGEASAQDLIQGLQEQWPDLPLDYKAVSMDETPAPPPSPRSGDAVDDLLSMVAMPSGSGSGGGASAARLLTGQIDALTTALLEIIFDNNGFKACEAAWRGTEILLKQASVKEGGKVRLRIVPVSRESLAETLEKLVPAIQGFLPNLVLVDLPFDSTARGTDLLEAVSDFADTMLAPTACWIGARFFHLDSWSDLSKVRYIKHHLEDAAFAKWRNLSKTSGATWLCLTCNRFLPRFPYGPGNEVQGISLRETRLPWVAPVWALGTLAAQSINHFGWASRFTNHTSLALKDLAVTDFGGNRPAAAEMDLSENRLMEFVEAGITPLVGPLRRDTAFIPKGVTLAGGSMNFQLFFSQLLGFILWCRDHMEETIGRGDIAANLKTALAKYWEQTGYPPPTDLSITSGPADASGTTPLTVSLTPPPAVLPGAPPLEFGFSW